MSSPAAEAPGRSRTCRRTWTRSCGCASASTPGQVAGPVGQPRLAKFAKEFRGPIEQMLEVVLPGYEGSGRRHLADPFVGVTPEFFEYLVAERGLRPATLAHYRHHLRRFAAYLVGVGVRRLDELSPALLSAFVAERTGSGLAKTSVRDTCGVLRVFLRYAHREGLVGRDLRATVEWPQVYRLSTIPRSIAWSDVALVLGAVDRRTVAGRRDYAILLLLVTYGLRAGEVAGLTLDDIDWKRERLAVPERKAGHSTAFPLSGAVGGALSTICGRAGRRPPTGTSSSGRWRPSGRSARPRSRAAPATTSARPASWCPGPARTPCATPPSSASSTPTSPSRRSATSSATGRQPRPRSTRRWPSRPCGRLPGRRRGGALGTSSPSQPSSNRVPRPQARTRPASTESEERELRLLVRFADQHGVADARLSSHRPSSRPSSRRGRGTRPRSFNHLLGVVRCLLDWAVSQELLAGLARCEPRRRRATAPRVPFLFDPARRGGCSRPRPRFPTTHGRRERGPTYRTTLRAPVTGSGCAPARRAAPLGDVDLDARPPHGPRRQVRQEPPRPARAAHRRAPARAARAAPSRRRAVAAPTPRSSPSTGGAACIPGTASQTFHPTSRHARPRRSPTDVAPPRLHHLRHSFAVGRLLRWYREGVDPATRLHHAVHASSATSIPRSTAVYLTITADLLDEANRRFEAFAGPTFAEATP